MLIFDPLTIASLCIYDEITVTFIRPLSIFALSFPCSYLITRVRILSDAYVDRFIFIYYVKYCNIYSYYILFSAQFSNLMTSVRIFCDTYVDMFFLCVCVCI